jgi:histone-lysine N-methyltransferase SETD2
MDVDTFKKHAKELTHIMAEEKKKSGYKVNKLDSL